VSRASLQKCSQISYSILARGNVGLFLYLVYVVERVASSNVACGIFTNFGTF